jgi:adenylosuccinate synthase
MLKMNRGLGITLPESQIAVVIGAAWGDEGKGKIVDLLAERYDFVVRFGGGANAGHTIYTPEGCKIVSHLIPCSQAQGKPGIIARGVFFDPKLFLEEYAKTLEALQGKMAPIYIDYGAAVCTEYHLLWERYLAQVRGHGSLGTTFKGIAQTAALDDLRLAPRVGDLLGSRKALEKMLHNLYCALIESLKELRKESANPDSPEEALLEDIPDPGMVGLRLLAYGDKIRAMVHDTSWMLHEAYTRGERILFEGAQATGLDRRFGTYPYVSSGNSTASGASEGTGLPMKFFSSDKAKIIMVAKMLPTRVGSGPFPTEIWNRELAEEFPKRDGNKILFEEGKARDEYLAEKLRSINSGEATTAEIACYYQVLNKELGATTGRGRSVGYRDLAWDRYAARINGADYYTLTHLDTLDGLNSIPVGVEYEFHGKYLPGGQILPPNQLHEVGIKYEEWGCWPGEQVYAQTDFDFLPPRSKQFVRKLRDRLGGFDIWLGTGPNRNHIIACTD